MARLFAAQRESFATPGQLFGWCTAHHPQTPLIRPPFSVSADRRGSRYARQSEQKDQPIMATDLPVADTARRDRPGALKDLRGMGPARDLSFRALTRSRVRVSFAILCCLSRGDIAPCAEAMSVAGGTFAGIGQLAGGRHPPVLGPEAGEGLRPATPCRA